MALDSLQTRKCMMILFQQPIRTGNRPLTTLEQETLAVLAAIDADQEQMVSDLLTAWDAVWLDESSITANTSNKGFSTSGERSRRVIRSQLVAILSYDPAPSGPMIGRG